jgi:hypothetical protein
MTNCMNDEECTRKCIIDELMGFLPGMAEFSESANVTQYKEPSAVVVFLDLTLKLTSLLKIGRETFRPFIRSVLE